MKRRLINTTVLFACLLYLVTTISLLEYFLESHSEAINTEIEQDFSEEFLLVRANIESSLYSDAFIANGLITVLSVNKSIALDNFEAFAKALIQNGRYIRNIGVAEGYVISKVYPLQGNEKAIGLDFRTSPEQFKTFERARQSKNVVLAGPLELVQGGQAIIARFPVFEDFPINSQYWGGVSIVLNVDELFRDAGLLRLLEKYDVAIRGLDGTGEEGPVFIGNPSVFDDPDITSVIEIPGGNWVMAANTASLQSGTMFNTIAIYRVMGYCIIVLVLISILSLYRSYRLAHDASIVDELTGLRNRRYAFNYMRSLINDRKKSSFSLISIDLNGFKSINDTFGHQVGDNVLIEIARIISNNLRSTDKCCRLGGDEFLVILPRVKDKSVIESIIRKLKTAVAGNEFEHNRKTMGVTLSAGYAIYPDDSGDLEGLVSISDGMMYKDKQRLQSASGNAIE